MKRIREVKEVYEMIAPSWHIFKKKPVPEVKEILNKWEEEGRKLILDAGSGTGRHSRPNKKMKIINLDLSKQMIRISGQGVVASITHPPFKNKTFDAVLAIAVLHHLPTKNAVPALKELKKVMKENAELFISVWNKWQKKFFLSKKEVLVPWTVQGKKHYRYYNLYTPRELIKQVKKAGLILINAYPDHRFNKPKFLMRFSRNTFALCRK